ncbi:DUF1294 domain-containing protein [Mucisphaera sp.]|uniref:DUF1294 domain-containing protein n=1 Tax=Mucisphaera sp. TaxID=2913024 RepID=UPI003D0EF36E
MPIELQVYIVLLAVMSLLAIVMYASDKRSAIRQKQRTPEGRLHLIELLGGYPGGFLARRWFRHKSQKRSFQFVSWVIILLHVGLIGGWLYLRFGSA